MVASHVERLQTHMPRLQTILLSHVRHCKTDMCWMKTMLVTYTQLRLTCVQAKRDAGEPRMTIDDHVMHANGNAGTPNPIFTYH